MLSKNPRKSHGKAFAYSVDSAGSDKLNNFVGQIQNYDDLIVGVPLPEVTRVERYCRSIYSLEEENTLGAQK